MNETPALHDFRETCRLGGFPEKHLDPTEWTFIGRTCEQVQTYTNCTNINMTLLQKSLVRNAFCVCGLDQLTCDVNFIISIVCCRIKCALIILKQPTDQLMYCAGTGQSIYTILCHTTFVCIVDNMLGNLLSYAYKNIRGTN